MRNPYWKTAAIALAALCCFTGQALALSTGSAALNDGGVLAHPAMGMPGLDSFSIFTYDGASYEDALVESGFALERRIEAPFTSETHDGFAGTFHSEAWRHVGTHDVEGDGHILFLYRIENHSASAIHDFLSGSIAGGHWDTTTIVDAGIIHYEPNGPAFVAGDPTFLNRLTASAPGFDLYPPMLAAGESSSWIYFDTNAKGFGFGNGTVRGIVGAQDGIDVLVPMPEPATMVCVFGAAAALGGYIRKRRTQA